MKIAVVLIFVIFIPVVAFAAVIHVPGDYPTIQEAIDAAEVLDTVLVDPGTYVENIDFLGKDILVRSVFGPEVTVIDGNQSGSVVSFKSGESLVSLLEGFTLTNGSGTYHGSSYYAGGGIYCFNESSPMILNNIICYNETAEDYGYGGGIIAVLSAAPLIEGNLIHDNKAYYGGGICARSGSAPEISCNLIRNNESISAGAGVQCYANAPAMILNNVIRDNMALGSYGKGGGISCSSAQALICGNLIQGNQTGKGGAGIECFGDNVWIINNIIDGNISGTSGGGIYLNWSNSPVICNTIINNYAKYSGGGLYLCDHLDTFAFNNIFWDNDAGDDGTEIMVDGVKWGCSLVIGYCDVKDAIHSIWQGYISQIIYREGMIDADPLFVDFAGNDYHLTWSSPCRDAGFNKTLGLPDEDFEGDPRIAWGGTVDIGADEFYTHLYCTGDFTPSGTIEGKLVGLPGTSPVGLFFGSGVFDPPAQTAWGNFHLQAPWYLIPLVPIPAEGVLVLPATVPATPPAPYDLPMQALIGLEADSLTNLWLMEVR